MTSSTNEQRQYKYDAFISYRHGGVDEFVAKELHKLLEGYKLPAGVKSPTGKKKITKIFKDTEELPLASNLSDPIVEAIKDSEYLIVVCSPRLKESEWCKTEIKTFLEHHRRENVFCVIAEGEPKEVFPFALTMREDGTPVEPLAADFRGEDNKVIRNKMKSELLRLIAPMFELGYDDIRRREREQKIKVLVRSSVMITGAAVFLGAYFAITSYRLSAQNKKIEDQSIEISEQAGEILSQNEQLKLDRARDLSAQSIRYLQDDRIADALDSAYQAAVYNEDALPYTAGTQYALSQCLRLYEDGYQYVAVDQVTMPANATALKVSPDGRYVMLGDSAGDIRVYDSYDFSVTYACYCKIAEFGMQAERSVEDVAGFVDATTMYYIDLDERVVLWDISSNTQIGSIDASDVYGVVCSKTHIAVSTMNGISVYSFDDLDTPVASVDEWLGAENMIFTDDGQYFLYFDEYLASGEYVTEGHTVALDTGLEIAKVQMPVDRIVKIITEGEYAYMLVSEDSTHVFDSETVVYKVDYINSNIAWKSGIADMYFTNMSSSGDGKILIYSTMGVCIDGDDGHTGNLFLIGEEVVSNLKYNDGAWTGITETGNMLMYTPEDNNCIGLKMVDCVELEKAVRVNGMVIGIAKDSNRFIIYSHYFNADAKPYNGEVPEDLYDINVEYNSWDTHIEDDYDIPNPKFVFSFVEIKADNTLLVSYGDNTLKFFDTKTMEELGTITMDNTMEHYYGKDAMGNIYIGTSNTTYCINETYEVIGLIKSFAGFTDDGKEIIIRYNGYNMDRDYYTLPIYSYDDLVNMAEDKIH